MVNKIHLGTYVECITVAKPFFSFDSGIHFLVKDTNDDFEHLVIYNFNQKTLCDLDPDILIPLVNFFD